jgi:outer membrane protein assembly factor BamA
MQKSKFRINNSGYSRLLLIFIFISAWFDESIYGQQNIISDNLFPSKYESLLFEIGTVKFKGNINLNENDLISVIYSRPTHKGLTHKFVQFYYDNISKNSAAPKPALEMLSGKLKELSEEISYFNKLSADNDIESIKNYYNKKGYHDVKAYYSFEPDTIEQKNILTFYIEENHFYILKAMKYIGLDSLPDIVKFRIDELKKIRLNVIFDENEVINEVSRIHNCLLDNGYYGSYYEKPTVERDTSIFADSVIIKFHHGRRQKVGDISYVDNTKNQPNVVTAMKEEQMEFKVGDWYNRTAVRRSEENLRYLGTFDYVSIDTSSRFKPQNDTTLNFVVFNQYRELRELGFGLFVNQTAIDKYVNLGIEGSFIHRNIFGAAQVFNPFFRLVANNLSSAFENISYYLKNPELELQLGFKLGQPLLWVIDNSRVGLFASPLYSVRKVNRYFQLNTFSFPLTLAFKFPDNTYFNNMSVNWSLERQAPIHFDAALSQAVANAKTTQDTLSIKESLLLYSNLDKYINRRGNPWYALTGNIIGVSLIGDHRNNLFSPTEGDFANISIDFWNFLMPNPVIAGIAKYLRGQFAYYYFYPYNKLTTIASKIRLGGTVLFDRDNSYVPLERQFFAGGANSVRGWPSRTLRYTTLVQDSVGGQETYQFLRNFVGSAVIIEGSIEMRYRFAYPSGWDPFWADQWASMGLVFFLDAGNAFDWFVPNDKTSITFTDYFTKLAYALGIGLRYETPVGPVRIDFAYPIWDPNPVNKNHSLQFHVALGHAF